jgi:hypothetical protein
MDPNLLSSECLEQQRGLWLRLAESLEQAQEALLHGKVANFERCTEEQKQCCDRLRVLAAAAHPVTVSGRNEALIQEIRQVQSRVRHLNRVHAALLRRAARSLVILRNLLAGPQHAYAPAAAVRMPLRLNKG